jgi:hypothetical protein
VTRKLFAIVVFSLAACVSATGCKQGLGERCQVNSDCASGQCSMADPRVCVNDLKDQMDIDAEVPPAEAAAVRPAGD